MTLDDLKARIEAIEEGYEFFLAYAAQGLVGRPDRQGRRATARLPARL